MLVLLQMPTGRHMLKIINLLMEDEGGATAIEYALLAALISLACVGGLTAVGSSLNDLFSPVNDTVARCVQVGSNCPK